MTRSVSRTLTMVLGVGLLAMVAWGASSGFAAKKKGNPTVSSLKVLVAKTNSLPRNALPAAKQNALEKAAKHALSVARKRPCGAVKDLNRYRRILLGVKVRKGKKPGRAATRIAALGPISLKASSSLLAGKATKRCGGGTKPSRLPGTQVKIIKSDANGMKLKVKLAKLNFVAETGGGKTWTRLTMANTEAPGTPGTPGIPIASSVIGVPEGANVVVKVGDVDSYTLKGVNVYPAQPESVDADSAQPNFNKPPFASKPFTVDPKAYNKKGLVPDSPTDGGLLGTARDLTIGNLLVPGAQFNPRTSTLKVLTSVEVNVVFQGGPHTFSPELASPWEQPQLSFIKGLLNFEAIRSRLLEIRRTCGEEMLVITNPATRAAADTFATARRSAGFRTSVFETGTAAGQIGTTAADIQTFIRGRLTALLCVHPSYVTIMGDDDLVPTFTDGPSGIPSDLKYSMRNDTDELPDVAVGRIIGDNLAQVEAAVTKIIGYEKTAPSAGDFLSHATIAAQFQDDNKDGQENRTFIWFAETVRNGLVNRGVTVDRVYEDSPTTVPLKFNDGTPLPASLKEPTFAWNGTGADVSANWNAGRFLIIHRDHGWSDGWGHPGFGTGDVNALTNGSLLPVLMSINCSSAAYDYDETSFAGSALVKPDGGAVGIFGDTRDSPSWHNSQLGLGLVDALLPSVLPLEGPATKQRMGDALINGKVRLAGLSPPSSDGNTRNELYLWHYFGDPSMQMWGGGVAPLVFSAADFKAVYQAKSNPPGPEPFAVLVNMPKQLAGQAISLLRNGQVIGKAIADDGVATIPASFGDGSVKPGDLTVAIEAAGAQPVIAPVDGVPRVPTTLQQDCPRSFGVVGSPMTVTGTLSGAPAGSTVDVTFAPESSAPRVVHATTDAKGHWEAIITPVSGEEGDSMITSSFAGTDVYAGSSTEPCEVLIQYENF